VRSLHALGARGRPGSLSGDALAAALRETLPKANAPGVPRRTFAGRAAPAAPPSSGEGGGPGSPEALAKMPPWFMAVGFVRPHLPFVCPRAFWDKTNDDFAPGALSGAQGGSVGADARRGVVLGGKMAWEGPLAGPDGEPLVMLGPRASVAAVEAARSAHSGFGEVRDYVPLDKRTLETFTDRNGAYNAHGRQGGKRPLSLLRSDARRAYRGCIAFVDFEVGRQACCAAFVISQSLRYRVLNSCSTPCDALGEEWGS